MYTCTCSKEIGRGSTSLRLRMKRLKIEQTKNIVCILYMYTCDFIKTYKHFSLKSLLLGEQCCSLEIDTIQFNFSECHPPRLRLTGGRP